jgi:hypothetical protein
MKLNRARLSKEGGLKLFIDIQSVFLYYISTMNDVEMEVALSSGDMRVVSKLILSRTGSITWWNKGDQKRAERYGFQRQGELNRSESVQRHLLKRDELCMAIRNCLPTSLQYGYLLAEIRRMDEVWHKEFSIYDKERYRMAKQLEVKRFLKHNRHRFSR